MNFGRFTHGGGEAPGARLVISNIGQVRPIAQQDEMPLHWSLMTNGERMYASNETALFLLEFTP